MSEQSGTLTSNLIWKIFLLEIFFVVFVYFRLEHFCFTILLVYHSARKKNLDSEILLAYLVNSPTTAEDSIQQHLSVQRL